MVENFFKNFTYVRCNGIWALTRAPIQHFLSFLFPYGKPPISRQFGMLYQGEVYQVLRDQIVFPR